MRPATPFATGDCSTASSPSKKATAEPPVATVTASVAPMAVCEPIRAAATALNAIQLNAVVPVNMDSAPPCVHRDEDWGLCGSSSSSTVSDGLALEGNADKEANTENEEEDIVVDELDLYCSTTAGLYESSVKEAVPHCGWRAVDTFSSARRTTSSASSSSSTVSRKPRHRDTSVSGLDDRGEEEPAGGPDVADDQGSSETDDRCVARASSHLRTAAFAELNNADDAESSSNLEESRAAAPIISSGHNDDPDSNKKDSIIRQARASVDVTVKRSYGRDHCRGSVGADVRLSSPSRPAPASVSSSSSARRQYWARDSDDGRCGGDHGPGDGTAMIQRVAAKSTSAVTFDTQASPAPPRRSPAAVAAAALPLAAETKDAPYVPPLMAEFDSELLQLIKAYYLRKQSVAAESWSTSAPTRCAGHALDRMNSGSSSGNNLGGGRLAGRVAVAERHRNGGGSDAPLDARTPLLLSADDRRDPSSLLRGPVAASHSAATVAELSDASEREPQELRGRHLGYRSSSHVTVPSDSAALASPAAAGLRFEGGATHLPLCMDMNRVGVHGDGSRVGYGAVTATTASSFDVQQHTSLSAASLYDSVPFDEPSRGQHRAAAVRGAATFADGAASLHRQTHSAASSGGAGGALGSGIASSLSALSSLPSYSSTSFVRAYVSDISLSLEPAIIVSALTAALNIVVVYFLQQHVLDTRDHLGLFLIGSYMIFSSYYMIYYFLERFSDSFRRIASQDKKFYIIGNLIKAGILVSITPFACVHLVKIIVFEEWESNILRNLGCIYAIPDFISMVIVRRMRWSTWVHHACVVLFNYFSIMNNYQHENVCRCVVVYAAFSSFAYCVNVLLASRFLGVSANVARVLSFVALVVYALCCAVNWAWQVYYLRRLLISGHSHWTVYTYMFFISLVMWDDIVLNKWLLHHARNNAYAASQHLQQHRIRQQHQPSPASSLMTPARLSQRPSPLYRGQGTRATYTTPPPPLPAGLPPRAP